MSGTPFVSEPYGRYHTCGQNSESKDVDALPLKREPYRATCEYYGECYQNEREQIAPTGNSNRHEANSEALKMQRFLFHNGQFALQKRRHKLFR